MPYEAYVVRRTSTRPQVDSARASAATSPPSPTVARWSWRSRAAPASAYRAAAGSAPAHTPPDRPCPDPAPPPAPPPDRHSRHADLGGRAAELGADPRLPLPHEICWYTYILACFRDAAHVVLLTSWPFGRNIPNRLGPRMNCAIALVAQSGCSSRPQHQRDGYCQDDRADGLHHQRGGHQREA